MSGSPTVKTTVMLAGRVSPELKKRYDAARKRLGWNSQTALERVLVQWLEMEEKRDHKAKPADQIVDGPGDPKDRIHPGPSRKLGVKRG